MVPVYFGACSLCVCVGGGEWVGLVVCQGFLVRGACVCVLVGGDGSLLSEVQ